MAAANSQLHVVRCEDVSVDHIILGALPRGIFRGRWSRLSASVDGIITLRAF